MGNLIKSPAFQGKFKANAWTSVILLISILLDKPEFFEFITEFSKNVGTLYEHCLKHGFSSAWGQLIDSLDPLGERNALKVSDTYQWANKLHYSERNTYPKVMEMNMITQCITLF